jgi:hypothetical protein
MGKVLPVLAIHEPSSEQCIRGLLDDPKAISPWRILTDYFGGLVRRAAEGQCDSAQVSGYVINPHSTHRPIQHVFPTDKARTQRPRHPVPEMSQNSAEWATVVSPASPPQHQTLTSTRKMRLA